MLKPSLGVGAGGRYKTHTRIVTSDPKHSHSRRDCKTDVRASALVSAFHNSMKGTLLVILGCVSLAAGYESALLKHFEMDVHQFEVSGVIVAFTYDCAGARPCDHHRCKRGLAAALDPLSCLF